MFAWYLISRKQFIHEIRKHNQNSLCGFASFDGFRLHTLCWKLEYAINALFKVVKNFFWSLWKGVNVYGYIVCNKSGFVWSFMVLYM